MSNAAGIMIDDAKRKLRLAWYEGEIEKRGRAFASILRELRDDPNQPWLATHDTLDDYLRERWGITARRQRQLLTAETVRQQIAEDDDEAGQIAAALPERAIREIARIERPDRASTVKRAAASGRPTAKAIRQAIEAEIAEIHPAPGKTCPHCGKTLD